MCMHKYKWNRLDTDNKQQMFQWHWARKARVCMFYCEVDMVKVLGYGWHVLPTGVCVNCDCMLPWKLSLEYKWKQ